MNGLRTLLKGPLAFLIGFLVLPVIVGWSGCAGGMPTPQQQLLISQVVDNAIAAAVGANFDGVMTSQECAQYNNLAVAAVKLGNSFNPDSAKQAATDYWAALVARGTNLGCQLIPPEGLQLTAAT